jgi:hypothetical protein
VGTTTRTILSALLLISFLQEAVGSLALGRRAYGVYDREGGHLVSQYPFTRGQSYCVLWADMNPSRGVYNFEALDAMAAFAASQNQVFVFQISPIGGAVGSSMPQFIFDLGVPSVSDGTYKYGYYLDPLYQTLFKEMVDRLALHVRQELPKASQDAIAFIRVDTGATGDEGPYEEAHEVPYKYAIDEAQWRTFRLWVFEAYRVRLCEYVCYVNVYLYTGCMYVLERVVKIEVHSCNTYTLYIYIETIWIYIYMYIYGVQSFSP